MSGIKVEIKIHELTKTLQMFIEKPKQALNDLSSEIKNGVGEAINSLLRAEIDMFLGEPEQADNKKNGYLPAREFVLKGVGGVMVRMPKDRKGAFKSHIIPKNQSLDERLKADMAILHLAGISNRMLSMISKRLLGVQVSKNTVNRSLDSIKDEAQNWLTRTLDEKYWALYIDGTNFNVQRRGSTEKEPSLVVLGINDTGHRSVLAIEPGTKDSAEVWRSVFNSLKARGFQADHVKIGIMDGLPGLEKVFREEFTNALTARCWCHASRNILAKTPRSLTDAFKMQMDKIMYASSEAAARTAYINLKAIMGKDASRAILCLEKDLESLLNHYKFDSKYWSALRTTNPIERINKEFKRRTKSMETIGETNLMCVVAFVALRLEMGWRLKPVHSPGIENLRNVNKKFKNEEENINAIEKVVEKLKIVS